MDTSTFFDRDMSWLSFNDRVLSEAVNNETPLLERIKFLSIFSSNLDEFYRVRMPVLKALQALSQEKKEKDRSIYEQANEVIAGQLQVFGGTLSKKIIPALARQEIKLNYDGILPKTIGTELTDYFFNTLAAFLQVVWLDGSAEFFPENNKLYMIVCLEKEGKNNRAVINVPSDHVSRFLQVAVDKTTHIVFIDDIIKAHLGVIFPGYNILGAYNIKVTRDAELDLKEEFRGNIAKKIEKLISRRDYGMATRLLYETGISEVVLADVVHRLGLKGANLIEGGRYHNLKDLMSFPVRSDKLQYPVQSPIRLEIGKASLFEKVKEEEVFLHPPYQSYDPVLRFFNEASLDKDVDAIYTTIYRVAGNSRIARALISAACNGKKVTVLVELKARFDEANNIKWAKEMKAAGVKIIYSTVKIKVHAKVALVKRKKQQNLALLSTGNLNESTAKIYTDHILMTADSHITTELSQLFNALTRKNKEGFQKIDFQHLLVAQFNLQRDFLSLIDREIAHAREGSPAKITIKLNNLEEEKLINRLYEASRAGVQIHLIVRSICRLVPGVRGQSENIKVIRIVDRYLEHGRVFIFHNKGDEAIYLGSADWMNRNIYSRIEVCFPLRGQKHKEEISKLIALQLQDNYSAVLIDKELKNKEIKGVEKKWRSQVEIYEFLNNKC